MFISIIKTIRLHNYYTNSIQMNEALNSVVFLTLYCFVAMAFETVWF